MTAEPNLTQDQELLRKQFTPRVRTAAEQAEATAGQRSWNAKAHGPELAAYRDRFSEFERNNERLVAVGGVAVRFTAIEDPRDLGHRALLTQVSLLDRLIREQVGTLSRMEADSAAAQWQAALAGETPIVRWLVGQLEEAFARIEQLEAAEAERGAMRPQPLRSKRPLMSNLGASMGDGLMPGLPTPTSGMQSKDVPQIAARRMTFR